MFFLNSQRNHRSTTDSASSRRSSIEQRYGPSHPLDDARRQRMLLRRVRGRIPTGESRSVRGNIASPRPDEQGDARWGDDDDASRRSDITTLLQLYRLRIGQKSIW